MPKLTYKIGKKIKIADREYTVIGYEYIPKRAIRYILAHVVEGTPKWEYLFEFEIEMMIEK